ncbi:MAG: signal recognition particle-docking protein FtsY [Pseudomonadota bacterium]
MALFKKLKERLFKSSSKIDEGLEAIVSDGGEEEALATAEAESEASAREAEAAARAALAEAEAARLAEEERVAEAARAAAEEAARQAVQEAERDAAEQAAKFAAEEAAQEARAAEEAARRAAEREAEEAVQAAEAARAEATHKVEDSAVHSADLPATLKSVAPDLVEETAEEPDQKPGLLGRLMGRGPAKTVVRRTLDDDMLEQLEELLITADMGVDTALRVTANMAEGRFGKKLSVAEIKALMASEVARIMEPVARPLPLYPKTPQVVLVVGVNGSGKTTTIGKLASQFRAAGKKVVIAAGDTFRAAAVEQLQVWGERAGVPVLTAPQGTDPASLAFDAMTRAQAEGADLLMIDTAGRLQNRSDLMEELAKIVRVIRKKDDSAPHNTLLVLDATTGQNAVSQVKTFQDISDVSGLVMTKLDGTAKGGVLVALADKFGLPIHAIGVGEQIDDLAPFDPEEFADALVGVDR